MFMAHSMSHIYDECLSQNRKFLQMTQHSLVRFNG